MKALVHVQEITLTQVHDLTNAEHDQTSEAGGLGSESNNAVTFWIRRSTSNAAILSTLTIINP
jgi:hypothetical protein